MLGTLRDLIGAATLPLVRGSSSVTVCGGWITKVHHPTTFVRLLHCLAYGRTWHPYERREFLELAQARRGIACLLLEQALGQKGLVAPIVRVVSTNRGWGIVSPYVAGRIPLTSETNRRFFETICQTLAAAGLGIWQISVRHNPRAWTNAIVSNRSGRLVIIDLESQLPNVVVPWTEWQTARKYGRQVPFDEINFARLDACVQQVEENGWRQAPQLRREFDNAWASYLHIKQKNLW